MKHSIKDVKLDIEPEFRMLHNRVGVFNSHFQNFKNFGVPKAQLIMSDVPYNISNNAYASNPSWYIGGDNKNGESELAGEEFFDKLPELLLSPIAIVPSNTMGGERQLIILDYKLNGSYVCLSVRADGQGMHNNQAFPSTHVFSLCAKEKAEYILNCRINEELEHQKYVNKPCGIYYIDNKKATEMLNGKGFELPRSFNLNGLVNTIQGQSLIVKKK